jgi:tetratricopeptide (TPR) repeat protein
LLHAYILGQDLSSALALWIGSTLWDKSSAQDICRLGLMMAINQPDEALKILALASRLNPDLAPAILIVDQGINGSNPSDPMSYRLLLVGRALGTLGEWQMAQTAFIQASQISPDYAESWAYLSEAQEQLGQDGFPALNKALSLDPNSILIQGFMALYWENHGKPDIALDYIDEIIEKDPTNGMWQVEKGNALAAIGNLVDALAQYQKAVALDPNKPAYWRALANFSLRYNVQLQSVGLPAARKAVALDPENPTGLDLLAQFLLIGNDLSSAESVLLKAISIDPKNIMAQYHLGLTYQREGFADSAYQALTLAASLAEGQPIYAQIQQALDLYFPGKGSK